MTDNLSENIGTLTLNVKSTGTQLLSKSGYPPKKIRIDLNDKIWSTVVLNHKMWLQCNRSIQSVLTNPPNHDMYKQLPLLVFLLPGGFYHHDSHHEPAGTAVLLS
jgi:hypothetical protein